MAEVVAAELQLEAVGCRLAIGRLHDAGVVFFTEISLRELSDRVGLAKSNVMRYFDSREAIFLEVLDEEFQA